MVKNPSIVFITFDAWQPDALGPTSELNFHFPFTTVMCMIMDISFCATTVL